MCFLGGFVEVGGELFVFWVVFFVVVCFLGGVVGVCFFFVLAE